MPALHYIPVGEKIKHREELGHCVFCAQFMRGPTTREGIILFVNSDDVTESFCWLASLGPALYTPVLLHPHPCPIVPPSYCAPIPL